MTVGAITIRPPWLPGPGLVVDPGETFGLASHPTTKLCLELLQELPPTAAGRLGLRVRRAVGGGAAPRLRPGGGDRARPGRGGDGASRTASTRASATSSPSRCGRGPWSRNLTAGLIASFTEGPVGAGDAARVRPDRPSGRRRALGLRAARLRRARTPRTRRLGRRPAGDRLIRLAVKVRREDAEIVLLDLMAFAPGGLEEVDLGEHVEYVLYGAPGELPEIGDVTAVAGAAVVEVSTSEVPEIDWHSFHVPIDVGTAARAPALAPAARGRPGRGHRARTGVRHRLARDDPAVAGAAGRAHPGGPDRGLGLRQRHPRDRGREARLGPGAGLRHRARVRHGDGGQRAGERGDAWRSRAATCARAARPRRPCSRTSSGRCCCRWPRT